MDAMTTRLKIRPAVAADAGDCGRMCYQAFAAIAMYLLYRVESADTLSRFTAEVVPAVREIVQAC